MAEVLASLKKIGGSGEKYTETSLWTNPSPNSEFAPQTVTLSDSISNYKYIKFTYKHDSNNSTSDVSAIYIATNDLVKLTESAQTLAVAICARNSSNAPYNRQITYENGTSIKVHRAQVYNGTTINNAFVIPLEILGINELAHGTIKTDFGVLPYSLTESVKVTLGYKPSFVEIRRYVSDTKWAIMTYDETVSTSKLFLGGKNGSSNLGSVKTIPNSDETWIGSIDDDGFTINKYNSGALDYGTPYFRAIGS